MLDLKFIRENPHLVKKGAANKNETCNIDGILALDEERREIIRRVEQLKAERNRASQEIGRKKKAGEPADEAIAAMKKVGQDIASFDDQLRDIETRLHTEMSWVPNVPHESVPVGQDESANVFVREWGEKLEPTFEIKPHWEIGEKLGILDLPAAARVSGSGFCMLRGLGARLSRALINYMIDTHVAAGFVEVSVPDVVTAETMFGTGQLPKLEEDMYRTTDNMYLIPTAEVPMTNLYRDQIIDLKELPVNMVAHTPCFRREAGSAGQDTRGMLRVHQFDKVEMVKIVDPATSYEEIENLVTQAESVLQGLELPYRVCELATGDLSFAAAKCYDLELWAPGVQKYLEISSVSNFEDFQARRMNLRYRDQDRKVQFPHTLNGSGVALARLIATILEHYQNADGSVTVPATLRTYMGGAERIT
jgi:seryl-tRNA synthetase